MKKPPDNIDGATVLYWAWSAGPPFFSMPAGEQSIPIFGLAICRYSSGAIYRFSCDANWETVNDSEWGTGDDALADAMSAQSCQYDIKCVKWEKL